MRPIFYVMLLALLLFSCSSFQNIGKGHDRFIPSIGSIGKEEKSLMAKNFQQVGNPHLEKGIPLSLREIQFDRSKFKAYADLKASQGTQPTVTFIDSLRVKPKYLCLQLSNKIALQLQLNADTNSNVRSYLSNDDNFKIVTQISFLDTHENSQQLLNADGLFLTQCKDGLLGMELLKNGKRIPFTMSTMEIFEYELSGFCWDTDRYGKEKIASISADGEKCPKGTEKDAHKLKETKSYLKL